MLTSRCMLPWLRSAPYLALCPCEPLARSATCKPCPMVLVPDSAVHGSRPRCCSGRDSCMLTSRCMLPWLRSTPYPDLCPCEPLSPWARSATCKPCPMVLIPDSTVHCSRPPARNLHLSSSDHAVGPWVGFMYIYYHAMLLT